MIKVFRMIAVSRTDHVSIRSSGEAPLVRNAREYTIFTYPTQHREAQETAGVSTSMRPKEDDRNDPAHDIRNNFESNKQKRTSEKC